ncbi:MAG: hypothetical protein HZB27_07030 [Meiothermus silvanus]|nr:hypothetical protein [Allomeiothermus silvanus]
MRESRLDRLEKLLGGAEPEFIIVTCDGDDLSDPATLERIEQLKREAVEREPGKPWYVIYLYDFKNPSPNV